MKKPKFVAIEGVDGCGKTYLSHKIVDWLNDNDKDSAIYTSEPYDRSILDIEDGPAACDFYKDRILHFAKVIGPNQKLGKTVVCDRYQLSTVVHNHSSELVFANIWFDKAFYVLSAAEYESFESCEYDMDPDCYIVIDRPVADIAATLEARGELKDREFSCVLHRREDFRIAARTFQTSTAYCLSRRRMVIIANTADEAFEKFKDYWNQCTDKDDDICW